MFSLGAPDTFSHHVSGKQYSEALFYHTDLGQNLFCFAVFKPIIITITKLSNLIGYQLPLLVIKQIELPLRGRPISLITRMITDLIGLHSVLLPLLILQFFTILQENLHSFNIHDDLSTRFLCRTNYSIDI